MRIAGGRSVPFRFILLAGSIASICAAGRWHRARATRAARHRQTFKFKWDKKRAKKLRAELSDVDKTWLMEEVPTLSATMNAGRFWSWARRRTRTIH